MSDVDNKDKNKNMLNDICEIIETVLIWFFIFIILRTYIADRAIVDGGSMLPTLENDQRVLYSKIFTPEQNDIIIIDNENLGPIVKRVVATEGQSIDIKDGKVYVDGEMLDEQIYAEGEKLTAKHFVTSETEIVYKPFVEAEDYPVTVPDGCVFVLGDNRAVSNDSRSSDVGFVKKSDILGQVFFRYFPFKTTRII
ncbi:MAG: signal peptidase I [Oscillospiraceae bacterium]|nr:signal peptidase I [Oscillospiraceae bacterium]